MKKLSQLPNKGSNLAATDKLEVAVVSGATTVLRNITGQQIINACTGGGGSGTVTSVGLTMPAAFTVTGSPVTTSGTLAVTGAGTTSQYVRGDGTLATFPSIPGGTVTAVTGSSPIVSSGGTTPNITINQATTSTDGYLSSTDWNTFNNKQAALVSGTNIKTVNSTSLLGSGNITTPVGIHAPLIPASGGFINALMIVFQGVTTTTLAVNNLRCFPFIPMKSFTIVSYSIEVTTAVASSNMRVLFYDSLNGLPNAKLHESANIDSSTIGVKTVTQAYTFNAGTTYWLCVQSSAAVGMRTHTATGGAFAWQQTGASSNMVNMVQYTYAIGSAPATLTTTGASYATVGVPHLIFNL